MAVFFRYTFSCSITNIGFGFLVTKKFAYFKLPSISVLGKMNIVCRKWMLVIDTERTPKFKKSLAIQFGYVKIQHVRAVAFNDTLKVRGSFPVKTWENSHKFSLFFHKVGPLQYTISSISSKGIYIAKFRHFQVHNLLSAITPAPTPPPSSRRRRRWGAPRSRGRRGRNHT